jgi:DNA mismatch repair protein MutS2
MEQHSLDKLEFGKVRDVVSRFARTSLGREMAQKIQPSNRLEQVRYWLEQVRQMSTWITRQGQPPFGGMSDVRQLVEHAVPPHLLEPEELVYIRGAMRVTGMMVAYFAELPEDFTGLRGLSERLGDYSMIADRIDKIIDDRGMVKDEASPKLAKVRRQIADGEQSIKRVYDRLLRNMDIVRVLQYAATTFHGDRLVLPVKAEYRARVPGIVHRSSDSGATLFIEPSEVVELNNTIVAFKQEETEEVGRILWDLTHLVHVNSEGILRTMHALALLDLITAKALMSRQHGWVVPEVAEDLPLNLREARHPLLLEMHKDEKPAKMLEAIVPIDVRLGEDFDMLVITGPNTGGKTVTLKTIGLACVMAQAGMPIAAAAGSQLPIYRDILIDIGDEQSLQQSLSTFSAHLKQILHILQRADARTLVLMDELGSGTDPDEGAAIGQAIMDELRVKHCPSIITTHLGVLKGYAYREQRVDNAAVEFDVATLRPTYRLIIGEPGNSNAIEIARRFGMGEPLLQAARQHLAGRHRALHQAIRGTLKSRRKAEAARGEAEKARVAASEAQARYQEEHEQLKAKQVAFDKWMQRVTNLKPGEKVRSKRFDREATVVRVLLQRQAVLINNRGMEMEVPLTDIALPEGEEDSVRTGM